MTPKEIKDDTLAGFRRAVLKMTSPAWESSLKKNPDKISGARAALNEAQKARLKLENAQLDKIAKALTANEKDLTDGKTNLDEALSHLKDVGNVIDNVNAFLKIVIRVLEAAGHAAMA